MHTDRNVTTEAGANKELQMMMLSQTAMSLSRAEEMKRIRKHLLEVQAPRSQLAQPQVAQRGAECGQSAARCELDELLGLARVL